MFHPIDPKGFKLYEKNPDYFEKRVFLYSDRKPLSKTISWAGKDYKLGDAIDFDVPGKITQLKPAIHRLMLSYEGEKILKMEANGFLFIYSRSTSVSSDKKDMKGVGINTQQIHFKVYPLAKI